VGDREAREKICPKQTENNRNNEVWLLSRDQEIMEREILSREFCDRGRSSLGRGR
jgi:hypothetical protein